jgi:hypothetical protein
MLLKKPPIFVHTNWLHFVCKGTELFMRFAAENWWGKIDVLDPIDFVQFIKNQ